MKKYLLAMILAITPFTVMADITVDPTIDTGATITCTKPVEREDGTPLALGEVAEIRFYAGTVAGDYTEMLSRTECALVLDTSAMPDAPYYYVVTAVDTDGRESTYSPEFVLTVQRVKPPKAPTWQ